MHAAASLLLPCSAAPCWRLAVAVLSLALTGELALAMALGLTLALAPLPALAMALALTLAMAAAMAPAMVTAMARALVGATPRRGMRVLSGAVKRQHDPQAAAGGEFVWRMSLRSVSAMTPRLPAALPAAGETCISCWADVKARPLRHDEPRSRAAQAPWLEPQAQWVLSVHREECPGRPRVPAVCRRRGAGSRRIFWASGEA